RHVSTVPKVIDLSRNTSASNASEAMDRGIRRIGPLIGLEVFMREINPGIDDGHNDVTRIGLGNPSRRRGDLHHIPLLGGNGCVERVVWSADGSYFEIRLRVHHVRI